MVDYATNSNQGGFMCKFDELLSDEIEKQVLNRNLASKSYVKQELADARLKLLSQDKQIKKLFAMVKGEKSDESPTPDYPQPSFSLPREKSITKAVEVLRREFASLPTEDFYKYLTRLIFSLRDTERFGKD